MSFFWVSCDCHIVADVVASSATRMWKLLWPTFDFLPTFDVTTFFCLVDVVLFFFDFSSSKTRLIEAKIDRSTFKFDGSILKIFAQIHLFLLYAPSFSDKMGWQKMGGGIFQGQFSLILLWLWCFERVRVFCAKPRSCA